MVQMALIDFDGEKMFLIACNYCGRHYTNTLPTIRQSTIQSDAILNARSSSNNQIF